jgi:hypothetical protein
MAKKTKKTAKPKLPIPHWVCTGGCGFVANERVACPNPGCWRYRNYLTECRCKNGKHGHLPTLNVPKD